MGAFDEMLEILQSIDEKLGAQAEERAKVLKEPVEKKTDEKFQTGQITNAIQKGFAKIPGLNQLAPVFDRFNSLLIQLLALRGAVNTTRDANQVAQSIGFGFGGTGAGQPGQQAKNTFKDQLKDSLKQLTDPKKMDGFKELSRHLKEGYQSYGLRGAYRRAGGIRGAYGTVGGAKGAMGAILPALRSGVSSIISAIKPLLAHPVTLIIAAIVALVAAIGLAIVGIIKFAKNMVMATRRLAKFNAEYAMAFAVSDIRKTFRDINSAFRTSATTRRFLKVWNDFLDKMQPIFDTLYNLFVTFATVLLQAINFIIDYLPMIGKGLLIGTNPVAGAAWMGWDFYDSLFGSKDDPKDEAAKNKAMTVLEKVDRAMDAILEAYQTEDGNVPITAAAFMAGGAFADSSVVRDVNRPDLKLIWEKHQKLGKD